MDALVLNIVESTFLVLTFAKAGLSEYDFASFLTDFLKVLYL